MSRLRSSQLQPVNRYCLLLVDLSNGFTRPDMSPLATKSDDVIRANNELIDLFVSLDWPIIFTTVAYSNANEAKVFRAKLPDLDVLKAGSELVQIDSRLKRSDGDEVITKHWASAFFGTDLADRLRRLDVQGVVVTGLTTSGCVRATAVDAIQNDFIPLTVLEAVSDRDDAAHRSSLYDLEAKYADVITLSEFKTMVSDFRHKSTKNFIDQ